MGQTFSFEIGMCEDIGCGNESTTLFVNDGKIKCLCDVHLHQNKYNCHKEQYSFVPYKYHSKRCNETGDLTFIRCRYRGKASENDLIESIKKSRNIPTCKCCGKELYIVSRISDSMRWTTLCSDKCDECDDIIECYSFIDFYDFYMKFSSTFYSGEELLKDLNDKKLDTFLHMYKIDLDKIM